MDTTKILELLLPIADKLQALRDNKDKRRERVFEKLIEPLYKDLQLVHEDYMASMRGFQRLMRGPGVVAEKKRQAREYLEERREQFRAVRARLRAYRPLLINDPKKKQADSYRFLSAAIAYLCEDIVNTDPSTRSRYAYLLKTFAGPVAPFSASSADRFVGYLAEACEEAWKEVSRVFASIQVKTVARRL